MGCIPSKNATVSSSHEINKIQEKEVGHLKTQQTLTPHNNQAKF